ncbi:MAG: HAD family hydrolase [Thermodesulfobacteriota bacterium]
MAEGREEQVIKAVILDFDGTLAELNLDFSAMKEKILNLIEEYGIARDCLREGYILEIIDEVTSVLLKKDRPLAELFAEKAQKMLREKELEAASESRLLPGVESMLRNLRSAGVKVGIITRNCDGAVRRICAHIESLCDAFLSRDSVERVKPDPRHLATLLDRLGVTVEGAIMVGDHPMDILAGKRVGMRTVGVLTGRTTRDQFLETGADYVLESASQLPGLIERLNQ